MDLGITDCILVVLFLSLGIFTRVFRIQFPKKSVFDEAHFGTFTNLYLNGSYFTDIHPPLAKLIMAGVAKAAGYTGDLQFRNSTPPYANMYYVTLRMTPAFFGGMCVPIAYLIMRTMSSSVYASCVAAILVALDNMLIVEARHILTDGILHFFSILAMFSIVLYERLRTRNSFIFECICLGLASSCKFTSGGIVLLALMRQFDISLLIKKGDIDSFITSVIRCAIICVSTVFTIYLTYSIHLEVLPYRTDDSKRAPSSIGNYLVDRDSPHWETRAQRPSRFLQITQLILTTQESNMRTNSGHPYASPWWSWPLCLRRWVLYWTENGKHIICMGTVVTWYPVFIGVVWGVVDLIINKSYDSSEACLLYGYLLSYLPFILVPREMFIYHYAIPLIFGFLSLTRMVETKLSPERRGFVYSTLIFLSVFGYLKWNPWSYGLTTPEFGFLVWNRRWI